MSRNRTSSVANLAAMFENGSKKQENKPKQKVKAKKHALSEKFENMFKVQQHELIEGPRQEFKDWKAVNDKQKINESIKLNPGQIDHNWGKKTEEEHELHRPTIKLRDSTPKNDAKPTIRPTVKKLTFNNEFTEQLTACLNKDSKKEVVEEEVGEELKEENMREESLQQIEKENTKQQMMVCEPDKVIPPQSPQKPRDNARAYFSDQWIGPKWAIPYDRKGTWSNISDYVGEGSYPRNKEAFPNASKGTFDAIAIDANTRVILWEKENFQGKVLLDAIGPKLINNIVFQSHPSAQRLMTDTFADSEIEKNYPPNVRVWSETNMQPWTNGSVKIVAAP